MPGKGNSFAWGAHNTIFAAEYYHTKEKGW